MRFSTYPQHEHHATVGGRERASAARQLLDVAVLLVLVLVQIG